MMASRLRCKSPVQTAAYIYHNKGMDMIDLPRILNCKKVIETIPSSIVKGHTDTLA